MPKGHDVCAAEELMPGDMKCVFLGDRRVLLANVDGKVYATGDVCSHALAFLSEGFLEGTVVECPLHGARFRCHHRKGIVPTRRQRHQDLRGHGCGWQDIR
jgi:nitrite reductase/ring-hydroxylating ferredoxin subunit